MRVSARRRPEIPGVLRTVPVMISSGFRRLETHDECTNGDATAVLLDLRTQHWRWRWLLDVVAVCPSNAHTRDGFTKLGAGSLLRIKRIRCRQLLRSFVFFSATIVVARGAAFRPGRALPTRRVLPRPPPPPPAFAADKISHEQIEPFVCVFFFFFFLLTRE